MSIFKQYFGVAVCVFFTAQAWGQAASSPYSSFGIGEYYGNALIHNQGMGGTGVAQPQYWALNNQNPALLVYNRFTVFETGMIVESRQLSTKDISEKHTGGNLSYLAMAFPIKYNKWTTSLGLMPYTSVNYKFQYSGVIDGSNTAYRVVEQGSGGPFQLYWSNGVRINKEFTAGIKATYIVGSINTEYTNQLPNGVQPVGYIVSLKEQNYIKDFNFSLGGSYRKDSLWGKSYHLSLGAVYGFEANLNTQRTLKSQRVNSRGSVVESSLTDSINGNIFIPPSFTGGLSFGKGQTWSFSAEFGYQDWTTFRSTNPNEAPLHEYWRAAFGGEITPDGGALSYLKRITYRAGASYQQCPFYANNKQVNDFGITFGMSFPAGRSSLDLAVKVGQRGNRNDNLLQENYVKVYFGVTFNDIWFIKRKFD